MANSKTAAPFVGIAALKHPCGRHSNFHTAGYHRLVADLARRPVQMNDTRVTSKADGLRAEKPQRRRGLGPQPVWRGNNEHD